MANHLLRSCDVIGQIFLFEVVDDISVGVLNYVRWASDLPLPVQSSSKITKNRFLTFFCAFLNQFLTSRDVIGQIFLFEIVGDI